MTGFDNSYNYVEQDNPMAYMSLDMYTHVTACYDLFSFNCDMHAKRESSLK